MTIAERGLPATFTDPPSPPPPPLPPMATAPVAPPPSPPPPPTDWASTPIPAMPLVVIEAADWPEPSVTWTLPPLAAAMLLLPLPPTPPNRPPPWPPAPPVPPIDWARIASPATPDVVIDPSLVTVTVPAVPLAAPLPPPSPPIVPVPLPPWPPAPGIDCARMPREKLPAVWMVPPLATTRLPPAPPAPPEPGLPFAMSPASPPAPPAPPALCATTPLDMAPTVAIEEAPSSVTVTRPALPPTPPLPPLVLPPLPYPAAPAAPPTDRAEMAGEEPPDVLMDAAASETVTAPAEPPLPPAPAVPAPASTPYMPPSAPAPPLLIAETPGEVGPDVVRLTGVWAVPARETVTGPMSARPP